MNELEVLTAFDPATFTASEEAREELLVGIQNEPALAPHRRRRVGLLAGAAAALSLTGGGFAYAVLAGQPPQTALKINCAVGITHAEFDRFHEFTSIMDTASGDPVADCAAEYQRLEHVVPPLAAFSVGSVFIYVIPADWQAPPEWHRLPSSFRNDAARLELKQRLVDLVNGAWSRCSSVEATEREAQADLVALHLTGWTLKRLPGAAQADGVRSCAVAHVDEGSAQTILVRSSSQLGDIHMVKLATRLRDQISKACVTLEAARAIARRAVTDSGFRLADAKIQTLTDPSASCARVDLVPEGSVVIVLRGPKVSAR